MRHFPVISSFAVVLWLSGCTRDNGASETSPTDTAQPGRGGVSTTNLIVTNIYGAWAPEGGAPGVRSVLEYREGGIFVATTAQTGSPKPGVMRGRWHFANGLISQYDTYAINPQGNSDSVENATNRIISCNRGRMTVESPPASKITFSLKRVDKREYLGQDVVEHSMTAEQRLQGRRLVPEPAGSDAVPPKPLKEFTEQNFGVRFSHTTNLSISYNPHGGADRVLLSCQGQAIGGLLVCPAPPVESIKEFIETGKAHYKEKWGASNVDYDIYENPRKYGFHHLKTEVKQEDKDYVLERFVYLRDDDKTPPDEDEKVIRSISGAFSFEFVYSKKDCEQLKQETKTVIDTFRIEKIPAPESKKGSPK